VRDGQRKDRLSERYREIIRIHHECPCGIREILPEGLNISVRDKAFKTYLTLVEM
jgi:hypothetical protein